MGKAWNSESARATCWTVTRNSDINTHPALVMLYNIRYFRTTLCVDHRDEWRTRSFEFTQTRACITLGGGGGTRADARVWCMCVHPRNKMAARVNWTRWRRGCCRRRCTGSARGRPHTHTHTCIGIRRGQQAKIDHCLVLSALRSPSQTFSSSFFLVRNIGVYRASSYMYSRRRLNSLRPSS